MKKLLVMMLVLLIATSSVFATTGSDTSDTAWKRLIGKVNEYLFEIIGIVIAIVTVAGLVWWYLHRQDNPTGFKGILIGLLIVVVLLVLYFSFAGDIKSILEGSSGTEANALTKNLDSFTSGLSGALVPEGIALP